MGSLRKNDGDGNENGKKSNWFRLAKQQLLHVHHAFLYNSLPSLHDCDVKPPSFTFYGRSEHKTIISFFSELRNTPLESTPGPGCSKDG